MHARSNERVDDVPVRSGCWGEAEGWDGHLLAPVVCVCVYTQQRTVNH